MYEKIVKLWKSFQGCLGDNEILIKEGNNSAILSGNQLIYVDNDNLYIADEK